MQEIAMLLLVLQYCSCVSFYVTQTAIKYIYKHVRVCVYIYTQTHAHR